VRGAGRAGGLRRRIFVHLRLPLSGRLVVLGRSCEWPGRLWPAPLRYLKAAISSSVVRIGVPGRTNSDKRGSGKGDNGDNGDKLIIDNIRNNGSALLLLLSIDALPLHCQYSMHSEIPSLGCTHAGPASRTMVSDHHHHHHHQQQYQKASRRAYEALTRALWRRRATGEIACMKSMAINLAMVYSRNRHRYQ